jgi:hypothetical protein
VLTLHSVFEHYSFDGNVRMPIILKNKDPLTNKYPLSHLLKRYVHW